ncbi:MAG: 3-dehydroquinate synthase [Syntrophus sp. (in: bacteria)]|nr:3-dehydroquinate synthase [Syntrophus sp. (in: bacteria)]
MKSIDLSIAGKTCIILPGTSFDSLNKFCAPDNTVIICDKNIRILHGDKLSPYRIIEVEPGEGHKTLETVNTIYEQLLTIETDRSTTIVGVGGGIICDITGFAATTYLRGLACGFAPTTLLAQVDASVGGKNGVNYHGYKNLIGTFNQPGFVLCDFSFLRTLPYDELRNGIAEVIKSALISDSTLFEYIEKNCKVIISLNNDAVERIVGDSLKIKTDIVSRDEKESGERRKLNFGHTIGHAIEKAIGLRHGEAISIGMVLAAKLSEMRGTLAREDVLRIESLLTSFNLPTEIGSDRDAIMDAIRKDKKREGTDIHFVLLNGIGNAIIETIGITELEEAIFDLRQHL